MKKKKLTRLLTLAVGSIMLFSTVACSGGSQGNGNGDAQTSAAAQGETEKSSTSGCGICQQPAAGTGAERSD